MAQELQSFVKEALTHKIPRTQIREKLLAGGWQADEVENALSLYVETDFPIPVPRRKPYLSAREAFLYLILFFTLYMSAISFGTLIFQYINRWLPDPIDYGGDLSTIRNATATLIIAFPVFLFVSRLLNRSTARDPEKRSSKIRKWLTYITLFIAAGVIIGDLITLITSLLAGELTPRFIFKVLTVFVIAATIFGYYLWDLRQEEKES